MAKGKKKDVELPMMAVQSKVKEYFVGHELRTSGDALGEINNKIAAMLDAAVVRCKDNGRQTVKPCDL